MNPCFGIDYGYVCHLGAHCARVTPEATIEHRMLCEHLEFPHFRSHQGTTLQTLGRLRVALQKRGITAAVEALQREQKRFFEPPAPTPTPGAALQAAWTSRPQLDLFA
jgi:hypothetical protein